MKRNEQKPHIIIFNPDQWRGDVLGHMGNPAAKTPVLDEFIATDAVSFRNAFCQNPVCTPSRCSFMTGWYPHVHGHRTMHHLLHYDRGESNLLKILKDNGYFVWWAGKNDLIYDDEDLRKYCDVRFKPTSEDFERWGYEGYPNPHVIQGLWRGSQSGDNYYSFYAGKLEPDHDIWFDGDWARIYGALDLIREYDDEKPLCMYLPLINPHPPYGVEEPWFSLTDRESLPQRVPVPGNEEGIRKDLWEGKPSILKGIWERQGLDGWTEDRWTELRATYYGMCSRLDHQFGLVLDALRDKKMYNDSSIFLFSDHGDFTGDYGLVEKTQNTFEDCLTRVPFIIKPPKNYNVKGHVNESLVELVDFSATVFELTEIDPEYTYFGKSLLPVMQKQLHSHRDAVFCEGGRMKGETHCMERESFMELKPTGLYWPRVGLQATDEGDFHSKAIMCRTKRHKYVYRYYEQDELYDLEADPNELHNLVNDPSHLELLQSLKLRMLDWYVATCDVVPFKTDPRDFIPRK